MVFEAYLSEREFLPESLVVDDSLEFRFLQEEVDDRGQIVDGVVFHCCSFGVMINLMVQIFLGYVLVFGQNVIAELLGQSHPVFFLWFAASGFPHGDHVWTGDADSFG